MKHDSCAKSMFFIEKNWIFPRKNLLWPNKSNTQSKACGPWKSYLLATYSQNFKIFKEQVFELTTSFRLHRFSRLPEKKFEFFFYLGLHNGHRCFGPKFHLSSIFCFVSAALTALKTKIFPFFKNKQIWDTLMGFDCPKWWKPNIFGYWGPKKNFYHFWEHWPAHFFTTWWMRSTVLRYLGDWL